MRKVKSIIYFLDVFPQLSETFIINEILELIDSGIEVKIFSIKDPKEKAEVAVGLDVPIGVGIPAPSFVVRARRPFRIGRRELDPNLRLVRRPIGHRRRYRSGRGCGAARPPHL